MSTVTTNLHWQSVSLSSYVLTEKPSGQMDRIVSYLQNCNVQSVLDAGCWEGRNSFDLLKRGFSVTGLDISKEALYKSIQKMNKYNLYFPVVYQTSNALPFLSSQFDAVLSWRVLHNIADPKERQSMITELMRVLKPGGVLVASVRSIINLQAQYPRQSIQNSGAGFQRFYYDAIDVQQEFSTQHHTVLDVYQFTENETYNEVEYETVYWNVVLQKSDNPHPSPLP